MSGTKSVPLALKLKEGFYTRVEHNLDQPTMLCAVDIQGEPKPENVVNAWPRTEELLKEMVFCVKSGQQNYLLKVEENKKELLLETTLDEPNIASLTDSYWFSMEEAASQQYRIHSTLFPKLCLIIKEDKEKHKLLALGDKETTTFSIAVFTT